MTPVVEIAGVSKAYGALRPLRLDRLVVQSAESVAIVGLDRSAAEIFVNLLTGATLPDAGEIRIFGRGTADIADSADWLATVDRFGIVSDRAVLLDQLSPIQNLAMPFTLEIEPPPPDMRARAEALAGEVRIDASAFDRPLSDLDPASHTRVRLGRALAHHPRILLLEHATATLDRDAAGAFGRDARAIVERRQIALVAATADESFGAAVAARVFVHNAATGALTERRRGWFLGRR